jgi:RNA polymerase sigma-70 factor, ECF subfamily
MMSDPTDLTVLLNQAQDGKQNARDRLFARAADRVLLYARMRLGTALRARVDAMDVLQETFLHAERDWQKFRPISSDPDRELAQWLCAIAENRIRDLAAWHQAGRRDVGREARDVTEVLRQLHRSGHGPATSMVRRDERDRVADAVDTLPDEDREVLLLRHFEGLTIDAIADRTGRSASSVRRALGRSVQQLGRTLGANPGQAPATEAVQ